MHNGRPSGGPAYCVSDLTLPYWRSHLPTAPLLLALLIACAAMPALAHHVDRTGPPGAPARTAPVSSLSGFIDEVVIDNRIAGTTSRIAVLHADDGSRSILLGAGAASLQSGAAYTITGRANGHAIFVDSASMIASTDTRATSLAALPRVTVEGTLRLGHADNFDGSPSEFFYAIVSATEQYRVSLATLFEGLENAMTGSVSGRLDSNGELFADRIIIMGSDAARLRGESMAKAAPVTTSYLVIPVKFPTNAAAPFTYNADPFTVASLNTAVFAASGNSVSQYYKETSFGQQLLSGAVAQSATGGWLLAERAVPATCDIGAIATAAETAATARGYNLASYVGRVYVFSNNVPGCGWAGLAYVGWERSWIKQTTNLLVIGHELGHNFGLLHAASLDCGTSSVIGGTCSSSEYGDPFGIMGNQRAMHFSSPQKLDLGWITAGSVKTHTAGRQTYTLSPLETGRQHVCGQDSRRGQPHLLARVPPAHRLRQRLERVSQQRRPGARDGSVRVDLLGLQRRHRVPGHDARDALVHRRRPRRGQDLRRCEVRLFGQRDRRDPHGAHHRCRGAWRAAAAGLRLQRIERSYVAQHAPRDKPRIWLMNGTTVSHSAVPSPTPAGSRRHAVGDFNGDGKTDIVWRNTTTGATAVWLMNGMRPAVGRRRVLQRAVDRRAHGRLQRRWQDRPRVAQFGHRPDRGLADERHHAVVERRGVHVQRGLVVARGRLQRRRQGGPASGATQHRRRPPSGS